MDLWRKNGGEPQPLPEMDRDASGLPWTDLANNEHGRELCGWAPAPEIPSYDPVTHTQRWDAASEAWIIEEIPPAVDPEPDEPPPAHLTHLQFVRHAMTSAGLTPEGFLAAKADPNLAFFWAMFELAGDIERDDSFTREGADAWVATGHISEAGRDAIFATWPSA